jgi:hypothetical protein
MVITLSDERNYKFSNEREQLLCQLNGLHGGRGIPVIVEIEQLVLHINSILSLPFLHGLSLFAGTIQAEEV